MCLQALTLPSSSLPWSLQWLASHLPEPDSDERFALNALEELLKVNASLEAGTVQVLLRPSRLEARQACGKLIGWDLQGYKDRHEERKCSKCSKEWHFVVKGSKLCIAATAAVGIFRFASTFQQLLLTDKKLPSFVLEDWPRFCWRGLQLDTVRHFMPVDFLKQYMAQMVYYKANYFHWHLTDDQSWRLFIPKRPKLVEASRDTSPESYNEEHVKEVLAFATEHFITEPWKLFETCFKHIV